MVIIAWFYTQHPQPQLEVIELLQETRQVINNNFDNDHTYYSLPVW